MRTLSLILWLIGIAALGGIFGFALGEPMYIEPSLQRVDPEVAKTLLCFLGGLYAVSALASAYATGRARPWARRSYCIFVFAIISFIVAFLYIAPVPHDVFSLVVGPIFFALVVFALWRGWRVIERNVPRSLSAP